MFAAVYFVGAGAPASAVLTGEVASPQEARKAGGEETGAARAALYAALSDKDREVSLCGAGQIA